MYEIYDVLQVGLELLGAVAAATEHGPRWAPPAGHRDPHLMGGSSRGARAASAGAAAAAAAEAAAMQADEDGSAGQGGSYSSQRGRSRVPGSSGSGPLALVCQVRALLFWSKRANSIDLSIVCSSCSRCMHLSPSFKAGQVQQSQYASCCPVAGGMHFLHLKPACSPTAAAAILQSHSLLAAVLRRCQTAGCP